MADYSNITLDVQDRIATLSVNRPDKLNALNEQTIRELGMAMDEIEQRDDVGGVILTGVGEKAFVAGADIAELSKMGPVDGIEVSRLGIIPGYGGTLRLPRIVGKGRALELMLTAQFIKADEAYRIGLVNKVVRKPQADEGQEAPSPKDALLAEARAMMGVILANGPIAVGLAIECTTRGMEMSVDDGLAMESNLFGLLAATTDMREGMQAFLDKRKAEFTGR
jgi:enoyl-CoA hydratase